MSDVLLMNLPTSAWYRRQFSKTAGMPPLGLMYIGTMLKKHSYDVELIDCAANDFTEEGFIKHLKESNPKVVVLSTYNEAWLSLKIISKVIKETLPESKIIAGGAFATFVYEQMLNETSVDIISLGEGEYSILNMCNAIIRGEGRIAHADGIIFKDENGINESKKGYCRIKDLDELPFVDRSLVDISKYSVPFTISTSRGCPGACIFCSSRAFWGTKVYMRSAKNIFDEVMYLHEEYDSNVFQIADDTFTASRKRALDFCKMIEESGKKFIWGIESRADVIDENFLKVLKKAGCNKIQIGLESADNGVLKKLKKHVTIEQIENAMKLAYAEGMYITLSFIVGHACDTEETVNKTLAFAKMAKEEYGATVLGSINTPFPGTEQYDRIEDYGMTLKSHDWDDFRLDNPNISTENFSLNELRKLYRKTYDLR